MKKKFHYINGKKYTEQQYWGLFLEIVEEGILTSPIKMLDDELNVFMNMSDDIDEILRCDQQIYRDKFGRKYCPRCEKWFPEYGFYHNKNTSDGLMGVCKICRQRENDLRRRNFRRIEVLPNIFSDEGVITHGHHINNIFIVHLPRRIHLKYSNRSGKNHRKKLEPIIEQIYGISLKGLLTGKWT